MTRVAGYANAWAALMQLVREGYSWSGRERNYCFLGGAGGRFADVSVLAGLDFDDDGRAVGVVDWDRDGDLDLWLRNRTAPRLRLMLNSHAAGRGDFVSVRLRGTTSNRDGIGGVVEVVAAGEGGGEGPRRVRSVRAGGLFLSQGSKWLHFGMEGAAGVARVIVRWPGGERETFEGVERGGRFILEQGTGKAAPAPEAPSSAAELDARDDATPALPSAGSVTARLPGRVPFPELSYRAGGGAAPPASVAGRILVLWARTCPHCRAELAAIAAARAALREAGLDVLALSVDDPRGSDAGAAAEAAAVIAETGFPFAWGFADAGSLARIGEFEAALFDNVSSLSVPLSLLLDRESRALVLYRGAVDPARWVDDAKRTLDATGAQLFDLAPPFPGRWFTNALDPSTIAEFLGRRFQRRLPEESLSFLRAAAATATPTRRRALLEELHGLHRAWAHRHARAERVEDAAFHFEAALRSAPRESGTRCEYAALLASYGLFDAAERQLREVLASNPTHDVARRSLEQLERLRREAPAPR